MKVQWLELSPRAILVGVFCWHMAPSWAQVHQGQPAAGQGVIEPARQGTLSSESAKYQKSSNAAMPRAQAGTSAGGREKSQMESGNPFGMDPISYAMGGYWADTQRRVNRAWFPPRNYNPADEIVVTLKIHNDGRISEVKLKKPSENEDANDAAYKAIKDAKPFRQFPPGVPDTFVVELTFGHTIRAIPLTEADIAERERRQQFQIRMSAELMRAMDFVEWRIENYLDLAIRTPVQAAFTLPKGFNTEVIVATIRIHRDGHVTDVKLTKASKNKDANDAATKAIVKAAPFRPLPPELPDSIDAELHLNGPHVLVYSLSETGKAYQAAMEKLSQQSSQHNEDEQHGEADK